MCEREDGENIMMISLGIFNNISPASPFDYFSLNVLITAAINMDPPSLSTRLA